MRPCVELKPFLPRRLTHTKRFPCHRGIIKLFANSTTDDGDEDDVDDDDVDEDKVIIVISASSNCVSIPLAITSIVDV